MSLGIQTLACTGAALVVIVFRKFLKDTERFSQNWGFVTSLVIGLCMGGIADATIFPSRIGVFLLTTFLASMFVRYSVGTKECIEEKHENE